MRDIETGIDSDTDIHLCRFRTWRAGLGYGVVDTLERRSISHVA